MKTPLLLINCKNYGPLTGGLSVEVAKACQVVVNQRKELGKKDVTIAVAVPATELRLVAGEGFVDVPLFAQHLDPHTLGAATGKVVAENLKAIGVQGTLINHSEDQYALEDIEASVKRAKDVGLVTVVCAKDADVSAKVASFNPSFVAMEPPELIGGDVSVSSAQPELIQKTVAAVKGVCEAPVLVGAGVKNADDVRVGCKLGAQGILVASGVTKAEDKVAAIAALASGFD